MVHHYSYCAIPGGRIRLTITFYRHAVRRGCGKIFLELSESRSLERPIRIVGVTQPENPIPVSVNLRIVPPKPFSGGGTLDLTGFHK